jgi:excisionase family DNA binding protein
MLATVVEEGPVAAEESDLAALAELDHLLKRDQAGEVRMVGPAGESIALPKAALRALRQAVDALGRDRVVIVTSLPKLLTVDQAAALLVVPEAYLEKLLDQGTIPSTTVREFRRVPFGELIAYKVKRDAERKEAMTELKRLSEELGLYDE